MPRFTNLIVNNCPIIEHVFIRASLDNTELNASINMSQNEIFRGLVDTGAMATAISKKVVNKLGLDPKSKTIISSASHTIECNVYSVQIGIPIQDHLIISKDGVPMAQNIHMKLFEIELAELPNLDAQGIDLLIGMDIISKSLLIIDGDRFTFVS